MLIPIAFGIKRPVRCGGSVPAARGAGGSQLAVSKSPHLCPLRTCHLARAWDMPLLRSGMVWGSSGWRVGWRLQQGRPGIH